MSISKFMRGDSHSLKNHRKSDNIDNNDNDHDNNDNENNSDDNNNNKSKDMF